MKFYSCLVDAEQQDMNTQPSHSELQPDTDGVIFD